MPLIEFVGYTREQAIAKMHLYQPMFKDTAFASDVIFVIDGGSQLYGEPPFLRVRSRFQERLEITVNILKQYESIEFFQIHFQPKSTG